MKTVFNMKNLMIMKNYNKYICAFILLMGMNVSVWGVVTTAELNFGTAAVSETFEACTAGTQTTGSGSTTSLSDMTSYGVFTHCFIGKSTESKFSIQGSASPMTSKYLQLENNKNTVGVGFTRSFTNRGAFTFKIAKSSKAYIGLYAAAPNNNAIAKDNVAVFLNFTGSAIQIHNGSTGGWVNAVTSLPDGDILEIAIVYNTSTATTYGNSIPLGANRAHIYVNGSAKMSGDVPQEFTIPSSRSLSFFNITYGQSSTTAKIDDIAIYDALPTKAGNTITLNKNNVDDGSTGGTGTILTDATSMTIDAAPTRTGYTVEGYYTAASDGVKIAAANGALQSNVTVSSTSWTNGSGVWQNVGDKTFYTYWSPIEYIIEYNKNNNAATGTMEDQEFVYGTAQNLSKCGFSREGYTFSGWATTADGGKEYDDEEEVNNLTSTEDDIITLFAVWTPNNYKLTVGAPTNVTIKATPDDKSDITEGNFDAAVPCDAIITLDAVVDAGYSQAGWKITKDADGSDVTTSYLYDGTTMFMPPFDATITATMYGDFVFSCSELTLTPHLATTGTPIFITSTASKTVRSQDYIEITGNGLTPSTALTFPDLPSKFAIKNADGTAVTTDVNGVISTNAYIFYTPDAGDTNDGLDKLTGITVSVGGAKPKTVVLTQDIIGRHLPADFVIAGKKDNKWYALPSNMASTTNPKPSEIAVNDINNPSVAYTAASNIYSLEGPTTSGSGNNISTGNGQYIRLTMSIDDGTIDPHAAPLFGQSTGSNEIGKSGNSQASSNLSAGWWWQLKQTNTSITNPQDAKYTIHCANNTSTLSLRDNAGNPDWGLFASGVEELRLIPASDIIFAEAEVVEWGQHAAIIEVDATAATGIDATSVIAHLGAASSSAITLVQTKASDAKNRSSKYNYTVIFDGGIDFAAAASNGAMLRLEWKKDDAVKAMSNIVVPKIVAASATMSSLMDTDDPWNSANVHVLPGVTLTANAGDFSSKDVVIDRLEIYPGATVKVTKGSQDVGTLKVRSLVLRNGWTRVGSKNYDVARLYVSTDANLAKNAVDNIWYSDWYIDYDQYYPIAVPFPVATNRITYKNTKSSATGGVTIRYYDGERRAEHEQQDQEDNWVAYTWGGTMPANLEPSKGYAMTAKRPSGKAFSIVRMPMTFTNPWTALGEHGYVGETHKDQVTVTGWGKGTTSWYAMGWNFVGNPYMCTFNGNDDGISGKIEMQNGGSVKYATIPDLEFQNYYQVPIAEADLKPASGFFIQANNADPQTITFNAGKIVPPSAPVRYTVQQERIPEQEAYIRLSYEGGNDLMGLIIGEDYTEGYEPNADLAKVLGGANAVKTYMHYADMDMAYVAINETLAKEWIPVTVNIPADGEYTYSLTSYSEVNDLEGVYLIDYMNSNQVTNLIEEDYTFVAEAGTSANRFSINAKVGQRNTPTDIDIINAGGDINSSKPLKFLWNDKVFILHNGVIYDATGKKVREINK